MDFSLRDLWWLKPKEQDNPLPALQLGVNIAQNKARLDLAERDLANDIARTSLARDEMMFKQNLMLKVDAGNAELAKAAAQITDFSDPAQMKPIYDLGARYGHVVGTKGWDGIINTHERAVRAKQLSANTDSLIAQREARTELGMARLELQELLADSTVELNDARILDLQNDIAFAERRAAIQEGNLELRREELSQKGKRLSIRSQRMYDNELKALNDEEKAKLGGVSATGDEASLLRKNYNLRRRSLTQKFYGTDAPSAPAPATTAQDPRVPRAGLKTEDRTTNAPPAVAAPADSNIRRQGGNLFQQQPDGTWKFIGPAQ